MTRRALVALTVVGFSGLGLVAPALAAEETTNDPIKLCVQFPGSNPRGPAPGYCLYLPDPTAPND